MRVRHRADCREPGVLAEEVEAEDVAGQDEAHEDEADRRRPEDDGQPAVEDERDGVLTLTPQHLLVACQQ